MKERSCNFCTIVEDNVAWFIGWIDGLVLGCAFSCSEYIDDDDQNSNIITEMTKGVKTGFKEGTWIGHLDK